MADISKLPGVAQSLPIKPVKSVLKKNKNKENKKQQQKNDIQQSDKNEADDGEQHIDEYV